MTSETFTTQRFFRSYSAIDRLFQERIDPWHFETSLYEQSRYAKLISLIERVPHERILEIGCAEGCFTEQLARIAREVVAVDFSAAALDRARLRVPSATFVQMPFEALEPPSRPYDVVVCGEVLYYVANKQRALSLLSRSGAFLVSSNCFPAALTVEARLRRFPLEERLVHGRALERKWCWISLRRLFEREDCGTAFQASREEMLR